MRGKYNGIFFSVYSSIKNSGNLIIQLDGTYKLSPDYKKNLRMYAWHGIGIVKDLPYCQWEMSDLPLNMMFQPFGITEGKFDLLKFNENYWNIRKEIIKICKFYNIIYQFSIFDWCGLYPNQEGLMYNPWYNNIQGINTFEQQEAWVYAENYIKKVWEEFKNFDNVILETCNEYRGGNDGYNPFNPSISKDTFLLKVFRLLNSLGVKGSQIAMGADSGSRTYYDKDGKIITTDEEIIKLRLQGYEEPQTGYMWTEWIKKEIEDIMGDLGVSEMAREFHGCYPNGNNVLFFGKCWGIYPISCRLSTDGIFRILTPDEMKQLTIEIFNYAKTAVPWVQNIKHIVEFCPQKTDFEYLKEITFAMAEGYKYVHGDYPENYYKNDKFPEEDKKLTRVSISPSEFSLKRNQNIKYKVETFDQDNNYIDCKIEWHINSIDNDGPKIDQTGNLNSGISIGDFKVYVICDDRKGNIKNQEAILHVIKILKPHKAIDHLFTNGINFRAFWLHLWNKSHYHSDKFYE